MAIPDASPVDRLPDDGPSFIGRRHEVSMARRLLSRSRLVTLTGAGGVGKTRLALRVAETLRPKFPDGVEVVELAGLEDAALLEPAVAAALGLRETGPFPMPVLVDYLADKRMLLVIDNCEHLLDACARLVDGLLRGSARLRILATSRQPLRVAAEQLLLVPSLSVPDPGDAVREVARREAVRMFVDRAAAVRQGFALDATNAAPIARLCRRLGGLPLAIELAAARLRTMPVEQLVRELEKHFEVLDERRPAATPRHQTLRAAMNWSFDLCSPAEQALWRRLSVFAGGFDLQTAEEVCPGEEIAREDVFDLVAGLVDKSILTVERWPGATRYRMLESLRTYGREGLGVDGEQRLWRRYCDHYRWLVETYRIDRLVPDQLERFRIMQTELPNIRVAIELFLSRQPASPAALEMASTLWAYWILTGSLTEGRHWLERGLELVPQANAARMTALWVDSLLALHQGDLAEAAPRLEECRALTQQTGNEESCAFAIQITGLAAFSAGDARRGLALLAEARARHRERGDLDAAGINLFYAATYGSIEDACAAAAQSEEFLALCEERHALVSRSYALFAVGISAWHLGDLGRAEALMREAAVFRSTINDRWGLTQCIEVLAWTACARGRPERAARMLGVAHSLWQAMGASPKRLVPHVRAHEHCVEVTRQALGPRAFAAAFRNGERLGPDRAVSYAIGD